MSTSSALPHPGIAAAQPATRVQMATRASRFVIGACAVLFVALVTLPLWGESATLRQITELACLVIMAQMWNLLSGYGGLTSIGQQAYIGIGGYTLIVLANFFSVNPFVCVPLAGLLAMLIAFPASCILFRLRDGYFAIGTWALAEIFRLLVANQPAIGGGSGTSLMAFRGVPRAARESTTYWIAVAIAFATIALVYLLLRSRYGLALIAVRDSEVASESQGIHVGRMKLFVYVLSALGFGLAGALFFLLSLRISPDSAFGVQWTPMIIFMVIIGGIGTIEGPLLGALLYFAVSKYFSDYGTWYMVVLGLVAVVVTIKYPKGLWGWASQRFNLHLFPTQRRLVLNDDAE